MPTPAQTAAMLKTKYVGKGSDYIYLKIVPNASPNADGEWMKTDYIEDRNKNQREFGEAYLPVIPKDHHIVAMSFSEPTDLLNKLTSGATRP